MSSRLLKLSTSNGFSSNLSSSISATDTTIALDTTTGLVAPGVLCIDKTDSNLNPTPTAREYVSLTGIDSNSITGVTRGVAGSVAQAHSSGAVVDETFTTTHWGDAVDFLQTSYDASGNVTVSSTATVSIVRNYTHLNASGASITGNFPFHTMWTISGAMTQATTSVGKPQQTPQAGLVQFFSAVLRTPVSGASLVLDINRNGTSIFTDQNTRLSILGGGTFVSTASIGTRNWSAGDILTLDIDNGGGSASDLTVIGRAV